MKNNIFLKAFNLHRSLKICMPVLGATVVEKGTANGLLMKFDGKFKIEDLSLYCYRSSLGNRVSF